MVSLIEYWTHSDEETIEAGYRFGMTLLEGSIVSLQGEIGTGKTTFVKGIVKAFSVTTSPLVSSPTFVYLNIYEGRQPVYHFDLYRLQSAQSFLDMGFDEYLFSSGVSCIEWSERISSLLPKKQTKVAFENCGFQKRRIIITQVY